jgi:hypothetical protein
MSLQSSAGISGVGFVLESREDSFGSTFTRVKAIITGGPVHMSGIIKIGDVVVSVDGLPVEGLPLAKVKSLVQGAIGSLVVVGLKRPDEDPPLMFEVELRRETVGSSFSSAHDASADASVLSPSTPRTPSRAFDAGVFDSDAPGAANASEWEKERRNLLRQVRDERRRNADLNFRIESRELDRLREQEEVSKFLFDHQALAPTIADLFNLQTTQGFQRADGAQKLMSLCVALAEKLAREQDGAEQRDKEIARMRGAINAAAVDEQRKGLLIRELEAEKADIGARFRAFDEQVTRLVGEVQKLQGENDALRLRLRGQAEEFSARVQGGEEMVRRVGELERRVREGEGREGELERMNAAVEEELQSAQQTARELRVAVAEEVRISFIYLSIFNSAKELHCHEEPRH